MLSQYMAGNYELFKNRVTSEWEGSTGRMFGDMFRDLLTQGLVSKYPKIGVWWDRKGNEIDLVGIDAENNRLLVVGIENMELTEGAARNILADTIDKVKYIKGCSGMQVEAGIAAKKIAERKQIEKDGFMAWELGDFLGG